MAFSVVAIGIIVLRRTHPDLERPFKIPGYPVTPILTVVFCAYIMWGLSAITWVIFLTWIAIVLLYYFAVGRRRQAEQLHLARGDRRARRATGRRMTFIVGYSPWHRIEASSTSPHNPAPIPSRSGSSWWCRTPGPRRSPGTPTASSGSGLHSRVRMPSTKPNAC